jgi:hypothetical protein
MARDRVVEFAALALIAVVVAIISYVKCCFKRICSAVVRCPHGHDARLGVGRSNRRLPGRLQG